MNPQQIYNDWKEQKTQFECSKDFPDKLMKRIYQHEQEKTKPLFDIYKILDLISERPLAKAALLAAGAAAGFVRLIFTIQMILEF